MHGYSKSCFLEGLARLGVVLVKSLNLNSFSILEFKFRFLNNLKCLFLLFGFTFFDLLLTRIDFLLIDLFTGVPILESKIWIVEFAKFCIKFSGLIDFWVVRQLDFETKMFLVLFGMKPFKFLVFNCSKFVPYLFWLSYLFFIIFEFRESDNFVFFLLFLFLFDDEIVVLSFSGMLLIKNNYSIYNLMF